MSPWILDENGEFIDDFDCNIRCHCRPTCVLWKFETPTLGLSGSLEPVWPSPGPKKGSSGEGLGSQPSVLAILQRFMPASSEPLLAEGEPVPKGSPFKALTDVGSAILKPVVYAGDAVNSTLARSGSEVVSVATTGKLLSTRENESAVKLQAAIRGKQTRREIAEKKNASSGYFCVGRRKKQVKVQDDGWLSGCACGFRRKGSAKAKIPKGGLPGMARKPSFPKAEDFDKAKTLTEKM